MRNSLAKANTSRGPLQISSKTSRPYRQIDSKQGTWAGMKLALHARDCGETIKQRLKGNHGAAMTTQSTQGGCCAQQPGKGQHLKGTAADLIQDQQTLQTDRFEAGNLGWNETRPHGRAISFTHHQSAAIKIIRPNQNGPNRTRFFVLMWCH